MRKSLINRPSLTGRTIKDGINNKYKVNILKLCEWRERAILDNREYKVKFFNKKYFMKKFVKN